MPSVLFSPACTQKFAEHVADLVARGVFHRGHRGADFLHFARAEVLEDFRGIVLAERHQEDRAFLYTITCSLPATQSFTTCATIFGSCLAICLAFCSELW